MTSTEVPVKKSIVISVFLFGAAVGAFAVNAFARRANVLNAAVVPSPDRVFEIRTYTVAPGSLPLLNRRFRDHTVSIFSRLGMQSIGYWTPLDSAKSETTLIYVLAHPSRDAAAKAWSDFGKDPEWVKVRTASEAEGLKVLKVESVFAAPTDYSPIR
jgi:hypothetical protein